MDVENCGNRIVNIRSTDQDSNEQCRICLKYSTSHWDLFRDGKNIAGKLMTFANVQVQEGDGLPTIICLNCRHLVDLSFDFKCQVEQSDTKLRNALLSKAPTLSLTHSINKVIAEAVSEEFPQQGIHCNVDNNSEPFSDISSRNIDHFAVQTNEQLALASLSNAESMMTFDISKSCDQRNQSTSAVKASNNFRDIEKQEILEQFKEDQSSRVIQDISKAEDNINTSFAEKYVKLEQIQNYVEFTSGNAQQKSALSKYVEIATENCSDSDEEETPLICRTQRQKCPQCIKTFPTKLALERHMAMHKQKTKLRYVCYRCDKQFSTLEKLKSHLQNSHEKEKDIEKSTEGNQSKGIESDKRTDSADKDYSLAEKRPFKFTCKVCSKQFTYQKSFITHAKIHTECDLEDIISEYLPHTVSESSSKSKETESEDEEILSEGLQCTKCGKLFATKRNLKRHLVTHTGLKYSCPMCGKEFSRIDKLREHEQSKHKIELFGQFSDDDNDEVTDNENKMSDSTERRKKEKYNRPHQCALCPKAFAQPQSLANHTERHKRVKDTQKRFLCEVCSKCFAQSGSLVAHMRTHTGVKPYVCNVCTKAFTKSTYLQLHLRTHSGEKPYICQYCSRAFARANTLARHITMHTGEAKYHCQICMKSFRRLTSLNEHTYTHTGQRPYACKICAKRYNNAGSLYAHTKKCKSQQQSGVAPTYAVSTESADNSIQNNAVPSMILYSHKKLVETSSVGQVTPTSQFMVTNVNNQKSLTTSIIQPFTVEDPNLYAVNAKQFKNSYYAIYPNI
ncbi:zinc finger protein 271-like [Belonocnema kinseyi]|uniref:zinc finger protein 271-like n=1 Tax=Belonocnema kinseyi TaxID=2817044 RepID=UPI00143DFA9C|nr:zinc finger protein 271-like [Belonocnema kinseyi]